MASNIVYHRAVARATSDDGGPVISSAQQLHHREGNYNSYLPRPSMSLRLRRKKNHRSSFRIHAICMFIMVVTFVVVACVFFIGVFVSHQQDNDIKNRLAALHGRRNKIPRHATDEQRLSLQDLLAHGRKFRRDTGQSRDKPLMPVHRYTTMRENPLSPQGQPGFAADTSVIPFVIMVFARVDYLQQVFDSIRGSDFPKERVPIIISHDGRVPEMMDYVDSLVQDKEFDIITLVHPFSCYEHPHSFPGNDTSLNVEYGGDSYGNPRSEWATCCKHHFTWMLNAVFSLDQMKHIDTFFFLEEDYLVSKTIYTSLCVGLNVMLETEKDTMNGYFGLAINSSNAIIPTDLLPPSGPFQWTVLPFRSGPMTMNRNAFALLKNRSNEYCTHYDEYNWDWTFYHLMHDGLLPSSVLVPWRVPLVEHIGVVGMHTVHASYQDLLRRRFIRNKRFAQSDANADVNVFLSKHWEPTNLSHHIYLLPRRVPFHKPSGGWNHPADHRHCMDLFDSERNVIANNSSRKNEVMT